MLCVVDLRDMSDAELDLTWTAGRVESLAKLVPDIGNAVGDTYNQVELARKLDVGIRNESALRYEVSPEIWESGMSIERWVEEIKTNIPIVE